MQRSTFLSPARVAVALGAGGLLAIVAMVCDTPSTPTRIAPRAAARVERAAATLPAPVANENAGPEHGPTSPASDSPSAPPLATPTARDLALDALRKTDAKLLLGTTEAGDIDFLSGRLSEASILDPERQARAFLSGHLGVWGLADVDRDLALDSAGSVLTPDDAGTTHVRFRQVVAGVPILRHALNVTMDATGVVIGVSGEIDAKAVGATIDPKATISSDDAIAIVRREAAAELAQAPKPELVAFRAEDRVHLAWAMNATSVEKMFSREYLIDAHDGSVLSVTDQAASDTATGTTPLGNRVSLNTLRDAWGYWYLEDATRPATVYTNSLLWGGARHESSLWTNALLNGQIDEEYLLSWDSDGWYVAQSHASDVAAHRNMGKVVDFWTRWMGRASYDNQNGPLVDAVHCLFNGSGNNAMSLGPTGIEVFGDGDGSTMRSVTALDVAAHEFTHTVVAWTAQLSYGNQPGALNEHFADAFGLFTERRMGNESGRWNFLMGEEVMINRPCLRNMADPRSVPNPLTGSDPDHMTLFYAGTFDSGGVHVNANILNQWLYLWLNGGTNRTSRLAVTGLTARLGQDAAFRLGERAYYRALQRYLSPSSTFRTFRAAMLQSITDLAGASSPAVAEATSAFNAIGLR